jgi:HAD superfamily hydrolase (TIGR01509 family)
MIAANARIALVIFDMDNVLVDYDLDRRLRYLSSLTGLDIEAIHTAIWGSDFERAAEAGAYVTGEDYLRAFNERLGFVLTREQWMAARGEAMAQRADVLQLARELRAHVDVAMLTNNGALLRECLPVLAPDVCEIFADRCHATYEFQARKPDPVVFERLLARWNVPASAAVFIDDDQEYIEGAITAGLRAIHYQGLPQLKTALREFGLPV